tara:strand:- start:5 stop:241 length:237 start_codon:yes stop_codon:yes gene_type:complete
MKFTVYSKENCPYCHKIKTVLDLTNRDFMVYNLNEDFTPQEFYEMFGEGSTFPQVLCDNVKLGGCMNTIKFLKEKRIV